MNKFHKISVESTNIILNASEAFLTKLFLKLKISVTVANKNLWFNRQCLINNVTPRYINIKTNNTTPQAAKAISVGKRTWLREEIKKWFGARDAMFFYLYSIHQELHHKLHRTEFDTFYEHVKEKAEEVGRTKAAKLEKKLKWLLHHNTVNTHHNQPALTITTNIPEGRSDDYTTHSNPEGRRDATQTSTNNDDATLITTTDTMVPNFYPKLINLSNVTLNKYDTELLETGFKYTPHIHITNKHLETIAIDAEIALNKLTPGHDVDLAKLKIIDTLKKFNNRHKHNDNKRLKHLKTTIQDNNLITIKADKGNTIVIMDRDEYTDKIKEFLKNNNYTQLDKDPTHRYNDLTRKTLDESNNLLTNRKITQLKIMNPQTPKLSGYPKIHKQGTPIRPVVSNINSPTYKLAKHLNTLLTEAIEPFKYTIKNSYQLIDNIKNVNIPTNAKLISFDVTNLFTNVPTNELPDIIRKHLGKTTLDPFQKTQLDKLIALIIHQNYFQFQNTLYTNTQGLAMGSPLSPLLADLYMDHIEKQILETNNAYTKYITYWYRYVDDTICLWTGTERLLQKFLNHINNIHPNITFTMELESNEALNFLDLTITKHNNKHKFKIYRKETYTDITINNRSNTHTKHKMAAFNSFIHRLYTVPMDRQDYEQELNTIKTIAKNNGYDPNIIDKLINKKERIRAQTLTTNLEQITTHDNKTWVGLTYHNHITNKVAQILKKFSLNIGYRPHTTLGQQIFNTKDKTDISSKSGIYRLKCNTCQGTYVGQTGRKIKTRIDEHYKAWTSNSDKSSFANHLIQEKHHFTQDSYDVLHICDKGKRMDLLENLEIHRALSNNTLCFNQQTNLKHSVLAKPVSTNNHT